MGVFAFAGGWVHARARVGVGVDACVHACARACVYVCVCVGGG